MKKAWNTALGGILRPNKDDLALKTFADAKCKFGGIVQGLQNLEWERLPAAAKEHIKKHPHMTSLRVALSLTTFCPVLVASPVLSLLGFGSLGFAASAFQSVWGTPLAFSVMQSATMGGSGAPIVSGVVSAGSLIASGVVGVLQKEKMDEDAGGKGTKDQ